VRNEKEAHTETGLPAIHLTDQEKTTVESPASLKAVLLARRSRTAAAAAAATFPFREIIGKKTRLDRRGVQRGGRGGRGGEARLFLPETENARAEERRDQREERGREEEKERRRKKKMTARGEERPRAATAAAAGGRRGGRKKRRMRWTRQKPRNVTCLFFTIEAHCS